MATVAQARAMNAAESSRHWLRSFFVQELRPYPGRAWTVARMTIAATLMMWWIMVFQIPGAALGAYYTLLFSRDSPQATWRGALTSVAAVGGALIFVLIGVLAMLGDPFLHFVWVATTLFVTFFLISTLSQYNAATAFGFLAVTTLTTWDFPANTEQRVEGTLWTALAVLTAAAVTVGVEFVFQKVRLSDQFSISLQERIVKVERAFRSRADGVEPSGETRSKVEQYAMTGTALLRRILLRANYAPDLKVEMSALVALIGRLIDLAAACFESAVPVNDDDRQRYRKVADLLHEVHAAVTEGDVTRLAELPVEVPEVSKRALLDNIENTVARIPQVFSGMSTLSEFGPSEIDAPQKVSLFKSDAFTNRDHLRFATKGMLAALTCYVLYNAVDWRGLSPAVATCMITALTTVGSSRQKQLMRVGGAILGSVVLGMSAQIFLLPHLDGIGGFTLLFVAVTLISCWIATSSPRLSYAGVQTAFAFYVTQLATFKPQISLTVARNDVCGILLGLGAMWLIFDQLWVKDTSAGIMNSFVRNLRRVARLDDTLDIADLCEAIKRIRVERAAISDTFDRLRNDTDALIFEVGYRWQQKVALRNQVRIWQPQLRAYFLLQIALTHYRLQSAERKLPEKVEANVRESRRILELLADLKDLQTDDKAAASQTLSEMLEHAGAGTTGAGEFPLSESMLRSARELAREMMAA